MQHHASVAQQAAPVLGQIEAPHAGAVGDRSNEGVVALVRGVIVLARLVVLVLHVNRGFDAALAQLFLHQG